MIEYKEKLWNRIREIASAQGLEVFDIETPVDFVRVFITRGLAKSEESELAILKTRRETLYHRN